MGYYKWGGSWKCKVREAGGLDPLPPPPPLSFLNKGHTYHLTTQDILLTLCTSFDANQLTPIDHNFFQQDTELQAWILDLHDNGYSIREDESDHGVPKSITTADQLTHLLTMMIFTFSCQHAAVNFSQMDTFGFPPNSPALMRQPPPSEKGKLSMKDMMQSLATKHQAGVTIATVYDLTRIFPDEVSISLIIFFSLPSLSWSSISDKNCSEKSRKLLATIAKPRKWFIFHDLDLMPFWRGAQLIQPSATPNVPLIDD